MTRQFCFAIRSANDGMAAQDLFLRSPTIDSKLKGEEEQFIALQNCFVVLKLKSLISLDSNSIGNYIRFPKLDPSP